MTARRTLLGAAATLAALALVALPAPVLAATCPRTSVADLEDEVMCPVCKTPLGLAQEAPQADRQRAFILERVERCESKATIKAALASEFGDEVLAVPEYEGFDLAAYIIPALALALGIGACTVAVARWRQRPRGAPTGTAPPPDAGGRARLERDLERDDL